MSKRESFIFYRSFYEAIKELPEKDQVKLFLGIAEYVLNGKKVKFSGVSRAVWTLIKPQLDANIKRYENGKLGASQGYRGGRPPNPKKTPKKPLTNPKKTPNANVNANVNDNVNVNKNENGVGVFSSLGENGGVSDSSRVSEPTIRELEERYGKL